MILFEGYSRWFKSYKVSKEDRFVIFKNKYTVMILDDLVDIEDEYNITFICMEGRDFIFRINHEH